MDVKDLDELRRFIPEDVIEHCFLEYVMELIARTRTDSIKEDEYVQT